MLSFTIGCEKKPSVPVSVRVTVFENASANKFGNEYSWALINTEPLDSPAEKEAPRAT